jgi:DNA-binding winged helix-turn-helix (wHTH) protein
LSRSTLKKYPTTFKIKKERRSNINPITAQVILFLADCNFALSPPDDDHWIPAQTIMMIVIMTPKIRNNAIPFDIIPCSVVNPPLGILAGGLIVCPGCPFVPGNVNAKYSISISLPYSVLFEKAIMRLKNQEQIGYNNHMEKHFESLYPPKTRFAEIEKLTGYIKEGNSCQLLGLPGTGRSTILSLLAQNKQVRADHFEDLQKHVHFVLANFSEVRKRPLFDVMKFLFLTLTESLRERGMSEENKAVGDIFREHLKFHDELVLFQGFKEAIDYLALEKKITIVFLFDRFEEYIPTVTDEFFTNLRVLRNRAKYRFVVIFSLYRPLETFLDPSVLADYYEFVAGHVVYLPLYDKVATDFRVSYIEKITKKKVSPQLQEEILAITGGIGRLVKLSVEATLAHDRKGNDLQTFLLQQKTIRAALQEIWLSLSPAEQADVKEGSFTDEEILNHLQAMGLVKEKKVQIPLLSAYLSTIDDKPKTSSQHITYDENTNTIKKGEVILSDQLTAFEFRLLSYLLQHAERIVDREELITYVWEGNKSTAGITDQAVDQLIFRVRRKIEEDANNPQHLLTVKGRGFRFIA